MKVAVLVFNHGDLSYAKDSLSVLSHYFQRVEYQMVVDTQQRDVPASWLKMKCHEIVPAAEFVLCWDLDLLPTRKAPSVLGYLDSGRINACYDTVVRRGLCPYYPGTFRYNCGLLGLPRSESLFCRSVFSHYPGDRPCWEQFYFNEELVRQGKVVHELPDEFNMLFPRDTEGGSEFDRAYCKHYTWGLESNEKVSKIANHCREYFTDGGR